MTKTQTAARDFATVLKANTYLRESKDSRNAKYAFRNNEVVFHVWDENDAKELPIEAFWYQMDSTVAYAQAKANQFDYSIQSGGENIPIVGIRLPTKKHLNIEIRNA